MLIASVNSALDLIIDAKGMHKQIKYPEKEIVIGAEIVEFTSADRYT